jgi:UDP-glucose 4-epimerase
MRGLVLGTGGFLGSHLSRRLLSEDWEVTGVVRDLGDEQVRRRLGTALDELTLVAGDAGDRELLESLVPDSDAIFPFAGVSGATSSLDRPLTDLHANVAAQVALLEVLRHDRDPARVVFPGSRLQYGRVRQLPVSEETPMLPSSPYGVSKLAAEQYHLLYHELHGVPTTSLRISNPYGPYQDRPDRAFGVVGTFMAMAARDETIPLFGGGAQLRDYVYVDDVVDAMMLAATDPVAIGRVYNVGGNRPVMLREMAKLVVETVGRGRARHAPWDAAAARVETGDYVSDLSRASRELGWAPTCDLADGLAATWAELEPQLRPFA